MQLLYTHVNKLVTGDVQICFPAPYFNLHARYSHMPFPEAVTSPGLPYSTSFPYASSGYYNGVFSYISLRLAYIRGLIIERSQSFPIDVNAQPSGRDAHPVMHTDRRQIT